MASVLRTVNSVLKTFVQGDLPVRTVELILCLSSERATAASPRKAQFLVYFHLPALSHIPSPGSSSTKASSTPLCEYIPWNRDLAPCASNEPAENPAAELALRSPVSYSRLLRSASRHAGEPLCPFTGHVALLHISLIYTLVMETEVASNSAAGNTAMTILVLVPSGLKEGFP